MPAPNTRRPWYFGCSTTAPRMTAISVARSSSARSTQISAPSSEVWSSALRKRGLFCVTTAALPTRRTDAPSSSTTPSRSNCGSSASRLRPRQQHGVAEMASGALAAEHRGQEQALVDLEAALVALEAALLGGDLLRRRHQARHHAGGPDHRDPRPARSATAAPSTRRRRRRRGGEETARGPRAPDPGWCAPRHARPHCGAAWAAAAPAGATPSANRPRISCGRRENRWSRPVPPAASRARRWRASPPSRGIPPRCIGLACGHHGAPRLLERRCSKRYCGKSACDVRGRARLRHFERSLRMPRRQCRRQRQVRRIRQRARSISSSWRARARAAATERSGRANSRPVSFS